MNSIRTLLFVKDATNDLQLPKVDPSKISKLKQRFITPSHFSTDFLFPGVQAFFKDFVIIAQYNNLFIEQLKITIINELIEMSYSSFEIQNLPISDEKGHVFKEYIVRPETISTMRILAKFLGFIFVRPYDYGGLRNTEVDNRQIQLRNCVRITI